MGTGGTPIFTKEERYAFRESLRLPSGLFMWLGALGHNTRGTFKSRHIMPKNRGENDFGLYVFTYAAGHFVFQLAAARWARFNPQRTYLPVLEQSEDWTARMMPFWPPVFGSLIWPPNGYLNNTSLDELADRWSDLTLSIG